MNLWHHWFCRSARWRHTVERAIVPWVLGGVRLSGNVLEIGPGPGVTTDCLIPLVTRLTCVETDADLAQSLKRRLKVPNVTVVHADATAMTFCSDSFDTVVSFTMLHHVPSHALQDALFAEVARVLRPGGFFAGSDSLSSLAFRVLHVFDTMVLVDPLTLSARLEGAGFDQIRIEVDSNAGRFRFLARRAVR